MCGLTIDDVRTEGKRPHIRVRKTVGKGGKARKVPLWWDQGTLDDLRAWRMEQIERSAKLFVCTVGRCVWEPTRSPYRSSHFKRCCDVLEGREDATVHDGRHSFVSLALAGGRSLAEVRDAAGHGSIATTSIYTHVVPDDGSIGGLFA